MKVSEVEFMMKIFLLKMDLASKDLCSANVTNLNDLDDIIEDSPQIKNIAKEFNRPSDFAKITTLIDESSNYSSEDKKIIKEGLFNFYKYTYQIKWSYVY